MLNNYICLDKVATWGLNAGHDEIYTNVDKNLVSEDQEIICYVYFNDIVDIKHIEINAKESKQITIQLWNYNMNIDFDSTYEDICKQINTNEKSILSKFDLTTDYFTLIIRNLKYIYNVTFYGKLNKVHTRELDKIRIGWRGNNCNDIHNDVKANNTISSLN